MNRKNSICLNITKKNLLSETLPLYTGMAEVFVVYGSQSRHITGTVPQIRPRPPPSAFFTIHYLLITVPFGVIAYDLRY
jgi:hypothetical protein